MLGDDTQVKEHIPVNTLDDSIYHIFDDGLVLCRLINVLDPKAIDEKKINTNKGIDIL